MTLPSDKTQKLAELLREFLNEGELVDYDPQTGTICALNEGVRRPLQLPEDVRQEALRHVRKPIYG